jgi:hypothetical protein
VPRPKTVTARKTSAHFLSTIKMEKGWLINVTKMQQIRTRDLRQNIASSSRRSQDPYDEHLCGPAVLTQRPRLAKLILDYRRSKGRARACTPSPRNAEASGGAASRSSAIHEAGIDLACRRVVGAP